MPLPALDPARVAEVLSRFSKRDRAIYRLVAIGHRSVGEVAARTQLSEAAVRRTVLAVRAALRELAEDAE